MPPLCFVRPAVIRRHGFDPLAVGLWFEVFARRCALAGENIAILPMLAGSLSPSLSQRPETTKRLSAGLLDELGRAAGWQARLLSIDPVETSGEVGERPFAFGYDQMRRAKRISPPGAVRSWEPVGWQENEHGILVHPLDGEITAAELDGPPRRIVSLTAYVRNVTAENDGSLVGIALVRSDIAPADLLDALKRGEPADDFAFSGWTELDAGRSTQLECPTYDVSCGDDKILLLTKLADGASDNNVQIVFTGIDARFDDHTVA